MEYQETRSKGIEIRIADDFAIIKPTTPFKFAKHEVRRKRNWSDSSDNSLVKVASRWEYKNDRRKVVHGYKKFISSKSSLFPAE